MWGIMVKSYENNYEVEGEMGYISILLYGERGLVNSVILEISNNIQLTRKVLGAVKLGDGRGFNWLEDIKSVDFWIEPSFGQFGNPDLIAICHCKNNEKYVVFFEAKTVRYEDSAMSLTKKYFPGINSQINAQLTLKYRFVQALTRGEVNEGVIKESPNMTHAYAQLRTDDKQKDHRKLANKYLVSFCREMEANCKGYYYVALTADIADVNISDFAPDFLPAVYNNHANNIWESEKQQFGILRFAQIESIIPSGGIFSATRQVVLPDLKTATKNTDAQILKTINWSEFSASTRASRSILQTLIM